MKKHPLLSFVLCASLWSGSITAQCKLGITLAGNSAIRMVIDDRQYFCQDNSMTIEDIQPGFHSVKVFTVRKEHWNNSKYGQLVYNGSLQLKPQFYTDIVVNRFGKTMLDEQPFTRSDFFENDERDNDNNRDQRPPNGPGGYNNNGNGGYGNNNNNGGNNNQPFAMTDDAFATALGAVRKESFDNNRIIVARQIADNNYFTAAQVKEIARLFAFDDKKLDFLKYAYGRTIDRNNYFIMNDLFAFTKSKDDLANYIKNYK